MRRYRITPHRQWVDVPHLSVGALLVNAQACVVSSGCEHTAGGSVIDGVAGVGLSPALASYYCHNPSALTPRTTT